MAAKPLDCLASSVQYPPAIPLLNAVLPPGNSRRSNERTIQSGAIFRDTVPIRESKTKGAACATPLPNFSLCLCLRGENA